MIQNNEQSKYMKKFRKFQYNENVGIYSLIDYVGTYSLIKDIQH